VSEYQAGQIGVYEVDSNGNPVKATRQAFITGLSGAEGAAIDPVTGDFLFSTFGVEAGDVLLRVEGFVPPPPVPEPASMMLLVMGLAGVGFTARRRAA
jgi:hypothetical protein